MGRYGIEGKRPSRCKQHATEQIRNVVSKLCEHKDCMKLPSYGTVDRKPSHCSEHASDHMRNVTSIQCEHEGCTTKPYHGLVDRTPTHCVTCICLAAPTAYLIALGAFFTGIPVQDQSYALFTATTVAWWFVTSFVGCVLSETTAVVNFHATNTVTPANGVRASASSWVRRMVERMLPHFLLAVVLQSILAYVLSSELFPKAMRSWKLYFYVCGWVQDHCITMAVSSRMRLCELDPGGSTTRAADDPKFWQGN